MDSIFFLISFLFISATTYAGDGSAIYSVHFLSSFLDQVPLLYL